MSLSNDGYDCSINSHLKTELYNIAHSMKKVGLPDEFITAAIETALRYEGVADIQELIDDCAVTKKEVFTKIKDESSQ